MKIFFWFFVGLVLPLRVTGQIIVTQPTLPSEGDSITLIYDASLGNRGLLGYTGDVYAHTGVITDKSNNPGDWKYVIADWNVNIPKAKLTPLGNNRWQFKIGPTVRSFYGVPAADKILKIAFVFRSGDRTREGKDTGNADIFVTLYEPGLNVTFTSPDKDFMVVEAGASIAVTAQATSADSVVLFRDQIRQTGVAGQQLIHSLTAEAGGFHTVEVIAYGQGNTARDSFDYLVKGSVITADLPAGMIDGINYVSDSTATLVLYAPEKQFVFAIGDFNDWAIDPAYQMFRTPQGDRYWITLAGMTPGREYGFQYLVDGELRIADPYAAKILDPWNDVYISESTYPGLKPYPSGKTSHAVSVLQTGVTPYQWKSGSFNPPEKEKLVIYELLIRDFIQDHSFSTLIDTLHYLKDLGINAIELMPVSEFEGNDSWGYNPSFYFAVDKYYGPARDFKALVDSAHRMGMAVILDMVLNHSYGQSPLVRLYWDPVNNRPAANNPWYNVASPNPVFSWGYDFNHESQQTRDFVDRVTSYWLEEFKVDGFRFDFTKGFTNTPGDGGAYDSRRIAILKRMAGKIWETNPSAYVILEHFAVTSEEKELTDAGMLVWGNANYSYRQATMGWYSGGGWNFSGISWVNRGFSQPGLVGYMESHDEERLMFECLNYGNSQNTAYPIRELQMSLRRMELGANFFIPVPGPKMIWMFGELGYDYSINHNGRVGQKPIRWDYASDTRRMRLYQIYGALNELKTRYPVFSTRDFAISLQDTGKIIRLNHETMNVVILGNFGIRSTAVTPSFQHEGWWYEYWSGDSVEVVNRFQPFTLQAGEYRFYTDVKLDKPDILSGSPWIQEATEEAVRIYPNPAGSFVRMDFNSEINFRIRILDITGRVLLTRIGNGSPVEITVDLNTGSLQPGIYFIELNRGNQRTIRKFVKE